MAQDDLAVLTAARGYVFVAPTNTASPTDSAIDTYVAGAVPAGWTNLGHTSRDNLPEFGFDGGDTETRGSWQTDTLKQVVTDPAVDFVTVKLLQWDNTTLELYYGVTNAATTGAARFTVASGVTSLPQRALLIIVVDGTERVAFYAPATSIKRDDSVSLAVDAFGELPIRFTVLSTGTDGSGGSGTVFSWIGGEVVAP